MCLLRSFKGPGFAVRVFNRGVLIEDIVSRLQGNYVHSAKCKHDKQIYIAALTSCLAAYVEHAAVHTTTSTRTTYNFTISPSIDHTVPFRIKSLKMPSATGSSWEKYKKEFADDEVPEKKITPLTDEYVEWNIMKKRN